MTLILAIVPVLLLIVLMAFFKMPGDKSSVISLIVTILIALFGFHYAVDNLVFSFVYGALKAVSPILIIILMAIFSYNVLLKTEKMEIIKQQFASISTDKSIQVLLLTWGFGGLLEAMAGFGTAVAIPAAILISLGFKPIFSATVSLIANSVATAFGAIGTPVLVLAKETNLDVLQLSTNVVLQLSVLMFLIPLVLLFLTNPKLKAPEEYISGPAGRRCFFGRTISGCQIYGGRIACHYRKYSFYHCHRSLWKTDRIERRKGSEKYAENQRYTECVEHLFTDFVPDHPHQSAFPEFEKYTGE